jgi:hypothetical protein
VSGWGGVGLVRNDTLEADLKAGLIKKSKVDGRKEGRKRSDKI